MTDEDQTNASQDEAPDSHRADTDLSKRASQNRIDPSEGFHGEGGSGEGSEGQEQSPTNEGPSDNEGDGGGE